MCALLVCIAALARADHDLQMHKNMLQKMDEAFEADLDIPRETTIYPPLDERNAFNYG